MRLMLRIVNRNSPPRSPFVLRGKEVIAEYLSAVCGSGARRRIEDQILSNIAWRCTGLRVPEQDPSCSRDEAGGA